MKRIDSAVPEYREGWDDLVATLAERDATLNTPEARRAGIGNFYRRRATWGWDTDLELQKENVHDISEAWKEGRHYTVRCSCGLWVRFQGPIDGEKWDKDSGFHNFHVIDRTPSVEFETLFYSAPGHRDAFRGDSIRAFIALFTTDDGPERRLWCVKCGDVNENVTVDETASAIRRHNKDCAKERSNRNIHSVWSWGTGDTRTPECTCGLVGTTGQDEIEFLSGPGHIDTVHGSACTVYTMKLSTDPTERGLLIRCHHCDSTYPFPGWGGTIRYRWQFDITRLNMHALDCFGGVPEWADIRL
jgi:hypothetical protein